MSDNRIFIDSNILLNLFSADQKRKEFASSLFNKEHIISTQVVNENVSVCIRKLNLSKNEAFSHGTFLMNNFILVQIARATIENAFTISNKYGYNFWDSLILSSALEDECDIIYSEDMQNGQIIEDNLKIVNPFKN